MAHRKKILPFFALLSAVGLLFSPLIRIHTEGAYTRDMTIHGLFIHGDTQYLTGISDAQHWQAYGLGVLLLCLAITLFTRQRIRLLALTFGVFIVSLIPVWMMVYVEDIIQSQIDGVFDHNYAYGMVFGMISLLCMTFSIVNTQVQEKAQAHRILDAMWD